MNGTIHSADPAATLTGSLDVSSAPMFQIGFGLKLENGILSVKTTDTAQKGDPLPISSAGVYSELESLESLLDTV